MKSRIEELDGIRGIAILMVLIWHLIGTRLFWVKEEHILFPLKEWLKVGRTGVDLFFVLSGFLIGGIILDNYRKSNFLKVFWIRRCCRILPVLYLTVFAYFVSFNLLDHKTYPALFSPTLPIWSYLTFTQNIFMAIEKHLGAKFLSVTWSLAIEEQFYIVAPLLSIFYSSIVP